MPTYSVAQIKIQGSDVIIVPIGPSFLLKSQEDQNALMMELQNRATAAGILGNVVPVWDTGGGKLGFRAPPAQAPFFQQVPFAFIKKNLNKDLYW